MSINGEVKKKSFERIVKARFSFVEECSGMQFRGIREYGGNDPRDAALVARFIGPGLRFDIGWNEFELSLAILIKFDRAHLTRENRYVYFEPFVEFLTNGEEKAIVPYIAENMSIREIKQVLRERKSVFDGGLEPVVEKIAKKMQFHLADLASTSTELVRGYHEWMKGKVKSKVGLKTRSVSGLAK